MRLYTYFRSSASYRCRIALNLKGVKADMSFVHLIRDGGQQMKESFEAINPQKMVPTLETEHGVLTQSLAIIEWLDETYDQCPLLPKDPFQKAEVRRFSQAIACDIHPLQNARVLKYLRSELGQDESGILKWCQRWLGDGLLACERLLNQKKVETEFCFGNTPGMADVFLVPQIFSANRFDVDLSKMPGLVRIARECNTLAAFQEAHPENQPDYEAENA